MPTYDVTHFGMLSPAESVEPVIELLSTFPTSVFTGLLVFCLTWWVITLLVSGLDIDADLDAAAGHQPGGSHQAHGPPQGRGAGHARGLGRALGSGAVPLPLALTLLAFGGWATSLVLQSALRSSTTPRLDIAVALGVLVAGIVGGTIVLRIAARPLSRVFETETAPSRAATVGATCKVRTLTVTSSFGDAEVLTGPTRGSIVRVRAADGRFTRGDTAHIIDFDESVNAYVIDELDDVLKG